MPNFGLGLDLDVFGADAASFLRGGITCCNGNGMFGLVSGLMLMIGMRKIGQMQDAPVHLWRTIALATLPSAIKQKMSARVCKTTF